MLVDEIEYLIRESERIYLRKEKAKVPGQDFIRRHFLYPISMISRGFDFAKKEVWIYSVLYILGIYLALIFIKEIPQGYPAEVKAIIASSLLSLSMFAPVFVALFLPPSTFTSSRIDRSLVGILTKEINEPNIEGLEKLLVIHQERIDKRITLIKRLYALGWAVFIYLIKQIDELSDSKVIPSESDLISLVIYGMAIMLGFFCVHSYSKSAETILTNIKVALIEKKFITSQINSTR